MMRLIDADNLHEEWLLNGLNENIYCTNDFLASIDAEPTIDVVKVTHAYWIYDRDATDFGIGGYVCSACQVRNNNLPTSICKNPLFFSGSKFCPYCGAKMDWEETHEEN